MRLSKRGYPSSLEAIPRSDRLVLGISYLLVFLFLSSFFFSFFPFFPLRPAAVGRTLFATVSAAAATAPYKQRLARFQKYYKIPNYEAWIGEVNCPRSGCYSQQSLGNYQYHRQPFRQSAFTPLDSPSPSHSNYRQVTTENSSLSLRLSLILLAIRNPLPWGDWVIAGEGPIQRRERADLFPIVLLELASHQRRPVFQPNNLNDPVDTPSS